MKLCTVEEMRGLDSRGVSEYAIPQEILMENAGDAVYHVAKQRYGTRGVSYLVLCGGGHNGGDGFVVARKLASSGASVRVLLLSDPSRFDGVVGLHYEMVNRAGIPLHTFLEEDSSRLANELASADVVVDAMLGTGIAREVGGRYRTAVEMVNSSGKPVLAVDIPSGIDGDTGKVWGVAIKADATVTFGLPKLGLMLYPGAAYVGKLYLSHISFPAKMVEEAGTTAEVNVPPALPPRKPDGHKGTFGDVLFVAGAAGYLGAPAFAALAMLRAGGGYARLAAPASVVPAIASNAPEVVFHPQRETQRGTLAESAVDEILAISERVDALVVGPGTSLDDETQRALARIIERADKPVIVDGDGLAVVARHPGVVLGRRSPTVLTPHPGEMAKLLGIPVREVLADRVGVAKKAARDFNSVVVLKVARSVVATPGGKVFVNVSGNSAMATAGSGDVLVGAVAAMYGLGLEVVDAVRTAVHLHGLAGDLAAAQIGADGVTARTLVEWLPEAVRRWRADYEELTADACGSVILI